LNKEVVQVLNKIGMLARPGATMALIVSVAILGAIPASASTTAKPCPFRITTDIEEPLTTLSEFELNMTQEHPKSADPLKAEFGLHNLYKIKDAGGNEVQQFDFKPNESRHYRFELAPDNPGLVSFSVRPMSNPDCAETRFLDTGFRKIVGIKSVTAGFENSDPPSVTIKPGRIPLSINLIRLSNNENIFFPVPLMIAVEARGSARESAKISLHDDKNSAPATSVKSIFAPNVSPSFVIFDNSWGKTGELEFHISKGDDSRELGSYTIYYRTRFPDWLLFIMTVAGALLYVCIESIPALNKSTGDNDKSWWFLVTRDRYSKILLAVAVSVIIFIFKDTTFFKAIKLDSSSMISFVIFGFCAGTLGLEGVLKKVKELAG
jgi:hypothetical protein